MRKLRATVSLLLDVIHVPVIRMARAQWSMGTLTMTVFVMVPTCARILLLVTTMALCMPMQPAMSQGRAIPAVEAQWSMVIPMTTAFVTARTFVRTRVPVTMMALRMPMQPVTFQAVAIPAAEVR